MTKTLYYIADPMCSWCWGFQNTLEAVRKALPIDLPLTYVMGGLARDSDEDMPEHTRAYVQNAWREVTARTGASFNWAFWEKCKPKRSTYPSCRAFYGAQRQNSEAGPALFEAIQRAYYQEARNPSDLDTLIALAGEVAPPLDVDRFRKDLASPEVEQMMQNGFSLRRSMNANQFPSLVLKDGDVLTFVTKGYDEAADVLMRLKVALA